MGTRDTARGLYELVQERLVEARALTDDLDVSDDVRAAVERRLAAVQQESQHLVTNASRNLDALLTELRAGRAPVSDVD